MEVKRVDELTWDVFVGSGWNNWTRFKVDGNKLIKVGGYSVSKKDYFTLLEKVGMK